MTNEAAIGYMILAAKNSEFSDRLIQRLEGNMQRVMDEKTEEEAELAYEKF